MYCSAQEGKAALKAAREKATLCTQLQTQLDQLRRDTQADRLKAQQLRQEHDDARKEEQRHGRLHQGYLERAMVKAHV
jgi:uncharacterized membrane protein